MAAGNVVAVGLAASLMIGGAFAAFMARWESDVTTFEQSTSTAVQRLRAAHRTVDGTGLGGLTIEATNTDRDAVLVRVIRAGDRWGAICRVMFRSASANRSQVRTDCTQPNTLDQPMRRLRSEALTIVVREHVAAAIEDRPYDIDRVATRMISFALTNRSAAGIAMRPPE